MSHLSHDELLDAAEGGGGRADHLADCGSCRAEVESLARVLREAAALEVPEPSPLFWRHFGERVSKAVAADVSPSSRRWPLWRLLAPALAVLLLVVVTGKFRAPDRPSSSLASTKPAVVAPVPTPSAEEVVGDDESWRVFAALASESAAPDEELSPPDPGASEGAVLELTDAERGELIRLLKAELARGGAAHSQG